MVLFGSEAFCGKTSVESLLPKEPVKGWTLIDGPQVYTERTLFEHINGQAELFLKYGFLQSAFGIYQEEGKAENQIEVDIYDMGNVLQAFGVFSRFRGEDRPMGIGLDSYLDDRSALFYKGRYFVMLYAAEPNPSMLIEFSLHLSENIKDPSPPPKEIGCFPRKGLRPGSIRYFPEGLLGHQFLGKGFEGGYIEEKVQAELKVKDKPEEKVEAEEKPSYLFLAMFENPQSAGKAFKAYREQVSKKGRLNSFRPDRFKGEEPYRGRVIVLRQGSYVLGAVGFEKEKNAEDLLEEFVRNVRTIR